VSPENAGVKVTVTKVSVVANAADDPLMVAPIGGVHEYESALVNFFIVYNLLSAEHPLFDPVIVPGVEGTDERTAIAFDPDAGLQLLETVTEIFPATALEANETVIECVPCPAVMLAPEGTVQLKAAPACAGTEYILPDDGRQKPALPDMFTEPALQTGTPEIVGEAVPVAPIVITLGKQVIPVLPH
jgi:hypothetical protein